LGGDLNTKAVGDYLCEKVIEFAKEQ